MPFKRRGEPTTIEDERDALRAQHAALEDLKHQLAERVDAVRERELELQAALAEAAGSRPKAAPAPALPAAPILSDAEADTGEDALEAERRERALEEREQAIGQQEALLAERARELELRAAQERELLAQRERELELRAGQVAALAPSPSRTPEPETEPDQETGPDPARLTRIEARLAELREAESLFLRTRDELAARSEAVAARERLVAQKERELDDREDAKGEWAPRELTEMEARLSRLEQQQPGEQTLGFSGGLRKLQQGTRPQQRRG